MDQSTKTGIIYALAAFSFWGFAPIYFKAIGHINSFEIVANRVLWSVLLLAILITTIKQWPRVRLVFNNPRNLATLLITTALIGVNWSIFIWSVNNDRMLESSLGYYINPLVNVLLGFVFLGECLNRIQWLAVALAVVGVAIQVFSLGYLPWISLSLAFSFGLYGLLHKRTPTDSVTGLFIETLLLAPVSAIYMAWLFHQGTGPAVHTATDWSLLLLAGPVTTLPLLWFSSAAKRLRLTTIGFFQYIGPSIMFLLAVFVYGESLNFDKLLTFIFIWTALLIFSLNAMRESSLRRKQLPTIL
ncbi:MAG: EamA family transporter RarD [Arenicella sp.]